MHQPKMTEVWCLYLNFMLKLILNIRSVTGRSVSTYCKSRIFRMHVIFVYFVRGGFRTKIKCMRKVQSKSENPQRSAIVQKFHAYESSERPGYENWVRTKYSGFTVCGPHQCSADTSDLYNSTEDKLITARSEKYVFFKEQHVRSFNQRLKRLLEGPKEILQCTSTWAIAKLGAPDLQTQQLNEDDAWGELTKTERWAFFNKSRFAEKSAASNAAKKQSTVWLNDSAT